MTEPVTSARRRDITLDADPAPPPPPTRAQVEVRTHDAHVDHVVTSAVQRTSRRPSDGEIQQRIDGVRDAFSGPYTVEGQHVSAPPMFRMNGGYNEAAAKEHATELDRLTKTSTFPARAGCGGPKGLVKVTQALIDAGRLPPGSPESLSARIKQMQWDHGIGVDCAAYTRAAFEAATGRSGTVYGLKGPGMEDFTGLATTNKANFEQVAVAKARPGDILTLKSTNGEVGHNVIVYANTLVAPGVHRLEVDSSWGAGTGQLIGGYRRDTWTYDEGTKLWTSTNQHVTPNATLVSSEGPADEKLSGVFRPR